MKQFIIGICVLLCYGFCINAQDKGNYRLIWADEFNIDGAVDSIKWRFEEGFVRNNEIQWYQKENAFCENGYLIIEARKEKRPNPIFRKKSTAWRMSRKNIEYTSSSINTRNTFAFQYGRLEVRAKVTNLPETWPAIWTLGEQCEWPSNGEVDVMENYGGDILANFAWGTDGRWHPYWDTVTKEVKSFGKNWTDDFHIWRLDWDEDWMRIYVDNELLNDVDLSTTINGKCDCEGENPFHQPHYILLNLALGGNNAKKPKSKNFPNRYVLDYVRVYEIND